VWLPSLLRSDAALNMTPEEIVSEINRENRAALYGRTDYQSLDVQQVLALMDAAAMRGFQMGTNVAMSMIQGTLLVQITRAYGTNDKPMV
jgi:hypothetical protein